MGNPFDNDIICILLFADDIVILGRDKTKIVHFRRNKSVIRAKHDFNLNENNIEIVDKYNYLEIFVDDFLDIKCSKSMLAATGGRSLGSNIISKFKSLKMWVFENYTKLYHSGVVPVIDYSSGI